jgi:hypothetical protein
VEKGVLWYKRPFRVHHGLGADGKTSIVCPTSINKKCPICEERNELSKDFEKNKEQISSSPLRAQQWMAYNIVDPDDKKKFAIFAYSKAKFAAALDEELKQGKDDIQFFFDVTKEGKTLTVRFSDATFGGHKFLETSRIDFDDRKPMDEDEVLEGVVNLDEMFNVMSYEKLSTLFLQLDEVEAAEVKDERKPSTRIEEPKPEPEPEPGESDEFNKDDRVTFKKGKKTITGEITKVKGDSAIVTDEEGNDHTIDLAELAHVEPEPEPEPEGSDEIPFEKGDTVKWIEDGEELEGEFVSINSAGTKARVKDSDDTLHWVSIAEVEKAKPAKTKPTSKLASKKSDEECPHKGGTFGEDCDKYDDECDNCPFWKACYKVLSAKKK